MPFEWRTPGSMVPGHCSWCYSLTPGRVSHAVARLHPTNLPACPHLPRTWRRSGQASLEVPRVLLELPQPRMLPGPLLFPHRCSWCYYLIRRKDESCSGPTPPRRSSGLPPPPSHVEEKRPGLAGGTARLVGVSAVANTPGFSHYQTILIL